MFALSKSEKKELEKRRGKYPQGICWFAVLTGINMERQAFRYLKEELGISRFDEILIPEKPKPRPTRRNRHYAARKPELYFGGYLFVKCHMTDDLYMDITDSPCIVSILGRGYRVPEVINETEMDKFRAMLHNYPELQLVKKSHLGEMVEIQDGMLEGTQARLVAVNAKTVKVEADFSFLGGDDCLLVTLPREHVRFLEESIYEEA